MIQTRPDLIAFVEQRLRDMHDRPKMWANTREAFVAQVMLPTPLSTRVSEVN